MQPAPHHTAGLDSYGYCLENSALFTFSTFLAHVLPVPPTQPQTAPMDERCCCKGLILMACSTVYKKQYACQKFKSWKKSCRIVSGNHRTPINGRSVIPSVSVTCCFLTSRPLLNCQQTVTILFYFRYTCWHFCTRSKMAETDCLANIRLCHQATCSRYVKVQSWEIDQGHKASKQS